MYEPVKRLGQNFLTDKNIVQEFVGYLNIMDGDIVVEIGSGLGALTDELSSYMTVRNFKCYALEIDQRFTAKLEEMFVTYPNMVVVETDALKWLPEFKSEGVLKVIGSLPFYITSPIIHAVVKMQPAPDTAVFLIQKEVAEKISAKSPDSSYFSVFVQTFYDVEYRGEISRKKFKPAPNVDGALIVFRRKNIFMDMSMINTYEGFLHKAFANPRKMLNKAFNKEELERGGIKPTLRAEALSAEEWLAFFKILHNSQD